MHMILIGSAVANFVLHVNARVCVHASFVSL